MDRGQYHLRQRVGLTVNGRIEFLTHPLTQVVLTSLRMNEIGVEMNGIGASAIRVRAWR